MLPVFYVGMKLGHLRWVKNKGWGLSQQGAHDDIWVWVGEGDRRLAKTAQWEASWFVLATKHLPPNTTPVIKSRRMRWLRQVTRLGQHANWYRFSVGKPEGWSKQLVWRIRKECVQTQHEIPPTYLSAGAEKDHETRQTGQADSGPRIKSRFNVWITGRQPRDSPTIEFKFSCPQITVLHTKCRRRWKEGGPWGQCGYVMSTLITVPVEKTSKIPHGSTQSATFKSIKLLCCAIGLSSCYVWNIKINV